MHKSANRVLWWFIPVSFCVIGIWFFIGYVVPGWIYPAQSERGTLGDQFGAVNSLFAGLAFAGVVLTLIYQAKELGETVRAQKESARAAEQSAVAQERLATTQAEVVRLQADLVKSQILLQLLDDIRSVDWGKAHHTLNNWHQNSRYDFLDIFRRGRSIPGSEGYHIDQARRVFIEPCYKMWHIWTLGIVDEAIARRILDEVIVRTLLVVVEPLEKEIRLNYDDKMFRDVEKLYSNEELESKGTFKIPKQRIRKSRQSTQAIQDANLPADAFR